MDEVERALQRFVANLKAPAMRLEPRAFVEWDASVGDEGPNCFKVWNGARSGRYCVTHHENGTLEIFALPQSGIEVSRGVFKAADTDGMVKAVIEHFQSL